LLSKLDELGLAGDTIVVLTADHGEEFWSHGWLGHTRTLYEDLVRVPLIVRDPRSPGGRVAAGPVSTVSITPTLVDLADLETGGARFQAPSLRGWLESDRPASDAPIFFDVAFEPVKGSNEEKRAHLRGVLRQGFKLIHDDEDGSERLFDLGADPGETRSVAGEHPELARELSALLERHAQVLSSGGPAASEVEPTADEIQALKDLGYAE
jgi:arylsulfatase A-like enzyme